MQRQRPRVRIVLCGLPTLSLNLKRARTYAERMFRHAVVGNLELDAAEEALAIPLAASGRSFGLSLIAEIVEQTAGYPYFLQFFAAFACSRIGLEHIELADYQRVESALLHELDLAFFEDRFEGARAQRAGAAAGDGAGGRVGPGRLRAEIPAGLDVPVGRRLIDRGLVYRPTRATYDFALPLFRGFIRRRRKLTELTGIRSEAEAPPRDRSAAVQRKQGGGPRPRATSIPSRRRSSSAIRRAGAERAKQRATGEARLRPRGGRLRVVGKEEAA